MQFRTSIQIPPSQHPIGYSDRGLLLGSCFTENIGARMTRYKLPVTVNPSGILFNPASIFHTLERYASGELYRTEDLSCDNGLWFNFDHHSAFSSTDRQKTLDRINRATETGARTLQSADYLILTLGTAWIYRWKSNGRIVCNCHKQPAAHFIRKRLSAETIVEQFALLAEGCLRNKRILWSVSPVRHIGDGLIDNAWSKAILLDAVHRIVERFPNNEYFPSFEIVNDDLRDYRFYDKDMVHPSELAVDYIWEQFQESHISHEARSLFKRIEAVHRAMEHRPFNPDSPAHERFRQRYADETRRLMQEYPDLDFTPEIDFFES